MLNTSHYEESDHRHIANYFLIFIFSSQFLALLKGVVDAGGLLFTNKQLKVGGSNETSLSHEQQGADQLHLFLGETGSHILTETTANPYFTFFRCVALIHWEFYLRNVVLSYSPDPFATLKRCRLQFKLICHCETLLLKLSVFSFMLGVFAGNLLFCINLVSNVYASIFLASFPVMSSLFFRGDRLFFIAVSKTYLTVQENEINRSQLYPHNIQQIYDIFTDTEKKTLRELLKEVIRKHEQNCPQNEPDPAPQNKSGCFIICLNTLYNALFFVGKFLEVYTSQIFSLSSICQSVTGTECVKLSPWNLYINIFSIVFVALNSYVAFITKVTYAELMNPNLSQKIIKYADLYKTSPPNDSAPTQDADRAGQPIARQMTDGSESFPYTAIMAASVSLNTATLVLKTIFNCTTPLGVIGHYKSITTEIRLIYMLLAFFPVAAYIHGTILADMCKNRYCYTGAPDVNRGLRTLFKKLFFCQEACQRKKTDADGLTNTLLPKPQITDEQPRGSINQNLDLEIDRKSHSSENEQENHSTPDYTC